MTFKKIVFFIIIFFYLGIIKKIEKIRDQETQKLMKIENDLKKKNEELIKTKNLISEEEFRKKVSSLRNDAKSFEELRKKKNYGFK